ncbi:MAG TPA: hypothetical protein VLG46_06550 [Anaerolineae bacterium]|nr:hypothetical protein [Anaerolineae bacterium]
MTANATPPKWTPPPPSPEVKPIVHRTVTLRVDLRALAALGGALIIVGSFLPWVAPQFQPVVRVFGPATSGGWPILLFGVLAIVLQFWPQFRTPRVSLPAAALGLAAGSMALASALNTIGFGRTLLGEQAVSPISGVGIGVYLTLAGSLIAILAGLSPLPLNHEPARAELRLWKASTAVLGALVILCGLGAVLFGSWIGSGGGISRGTPTPQLLDAGILATPLINVEVDPLEGTETSPNTGGIPSPVPPPVSPTPFLPPEPSNTPELGPTEDTSVNPTQAPIATSTTAPSATPTRTPTPTATPQPSPLESPTATTTPTATATPTPTVTPSVTP